ncbi:hypothetical protein [Saccharothrix texasensis]|nr:hypothetical protein [Saccharothrix texasensis]
MRRRHAAPHEDTMRYLELVVGPFQHDERALTAALDVLLVLRDRWKLHLAACAAVRRAEKRQGRRTPRGATPFDRECERPPLPDLHLNGRPGGP